MSGKAKKKAIDDLYAHIDPNLPPDVQKRMRKEARDQRRAEREERRRRKEERKAQREAVKAKVDTPDPKPVSGKGGASAEQPVAAADDAASRRKARAARRKAAKARADAMLGEPSGADAAGRARAAKRKEDETAKAAADAEAQQRARDEAAAERKAQRERDAAAAAKAAERKARRERDAAAAAEAAERKAQRERDEAAAAEAAEAAERQAQRERDEAAAAEAVERKAQRERDEAAAAKAAERRAQRERDAAAAAAAAERKAQRERDAAAAAEAAERKAQRERDEAAARAEAEEASATVDRAAQRERDAALLQAEQEAAERAASERQAAEREAQELRERERDQAAERAAQRERDAAAVRAAADAADAKVAEERRAAEAALAEAEARRAQQRAKDAEEAAARRAAQLEHEAQEAAAEAEAREQRLQAQEAEAEQLAEELRRKEEAAARERRERDAVAAEAREREQAERAIRMKAQEEQLAELQRLRLERRAEEEARLRLEAEQAEQRRQQREAELKAAETARMEAAAEARRLEEERRERDREAAEVRRAERAAAHAALRAEREAAEAQRQAEVVARAEADAQRRAELRAAWEAEQAAVADQSSDAFLFTPLPLSAMVAAHSLLQCARDAGMREKEASAYFGTAAQGGVLQEPEFVILGQSGKRKSKLFDTLVGQRVASAATLGCVRTLVVRVRPEPGLRAPVATVHQDSQMDAWTTVDFDDPQELARELRKRNDPSILPPTVVTLRAPNALPVTFINAPDVGQPPAAAKHAPLDLDMQHATVLALCRPAHRHLLWVSPMSLSSNDCLPAPLARLQAEVDPTRSRSITVLTHAHKQLARAFSAHEVHALVRQRAPRGDHFYVTYCSGKAITQAASQAASDADAEALRALGVAAELWPRFHVRSLGQALVERMHTDYQARTLPQLRLHVSTQLTQARVRSRATDAAPRRALLHDEHRLRAAAAGWAAGFGRSVCAIVSGDVADGGATAASWGQTSVQERLWSGEWLDAHSNELRAPFNLRGSLDRLVGARQVQRLLAEFRAVALEAPLGHVESAMVTNALPGRPARSLFAGKACAAAEVAHARVSALLQPLVRHLLLRVRAIVVDRVPRAAGHLVAAQQERREGEPAGLPLPTPYFTQALVARAASFVGSLVARAEQRCADEFRATRLVPWDLLAYGGSRTRPGPEEEEEEASGTRARGDAKETQSLVRLIVDNVRERIVTNVMLKVHDVVLEPLLRGESLLAHLAASTCSASHEEVEEWFQVHHQQGAARHASAHCAAHLKACEDRLQALDVCEPSITW